MRTLLVTVSDDTYEIVEHLDGKVTLTLYRHSRQSNGTPVDFEALTHQTQNAIYNALIKNENRPKPISITNLNALPNSDNR